MSIFLSIQHTYNGIEVALYNNTTMLGYVQDDKKRASKTIIALIHDLLTTHAIKLHEIAFFAVNQGPGPFTTLRVVIACVNGLSFATKKPLIGVDGLDALVHEHQHPKHPITVALLNAYTNDVYFALHNRTTNQYQKGCKNITQLLLELKEQFPHETVYFIGNGAQLHQQEITTIFHEHAIYADPMPDQCSIAQIAHVGLALWQQNPIGAYQLFPLYLKTQTLGKAVPEKA